MHLQDNTPESHVQIAGRNICRIEYRGKLVVTFNMVDEVHQRPEGTAGRTFRENRERFVHGEDFVRVCIDEVRRYKILEVSAKARKDMILLTRRGYLKLVKPLTDDLAWTVQGEMIDRYFASAELVKSSNKPANTEKSAREARLFMRQALQVAGMAGLGGNQRLIAAGRATRKATGFDYLAELGVGYLVAPQNDVLLNPTDIGKQLGAISSIRVNHLLAEHGFQTGERDSKGRHYWVPTDKGVQAGGVMVDVERSNGTGQARQLRWASSIVEVLHDIIAGRVA